MIIRLEEYNNVDIQSPDTHYQISVRFNKEKGVFIIESGTQIQEII